MYCLVRRRGPGLERSRSRPNEAGVSRRRWWARNCRSNRTRIHALHCWPGRGPRSSHARPLGRADPSAGKGEELPVGIKALRPVSTWPRWPVYSLFEGFSVKTRSLSPGVPAFWSGSGPESPDVNDVQRDEQPGSLRESGLRPLASIVCLPPRPASMALLRRVAARSSTLDH
jgi:hypothetical protein